MRRSDTFWGIALLVFGGLLLLEQFDLLSFLGVSVWQLIWPLLLILLGLWTLWGATVGKSRLETENLAIPLEGAEAAHITLEFGGGRLVVEGVASPHYVLEGTIEGGFEQHVARDGALARVNLVAPASVAPVWIGSGSLRTWSLRLSDVLPLNLTLKSGGSENRLDLHDLQIGELRIDSGASSVNVNLPAHAGYTKVRVSSGVASLNLRVPEGVTARIQTGGALSSINVNTQRFPRQGDVYQSLDYASAPNKVEISLDMGFGSVTIH